MKQLTPKEVLKRRMDNSYGKLAEIALKKTNNTNTTITYAGIGLKLGLTGQSVRNYVKAKCKNGNGYVIDALIEEFKKL